MSTERKKVFITSALPFCNAVCHAGNLVGSTLSADIYARYQRKLGNDVMYVCGTDNYGTQTELKAKKEGLSCEELCAKYKALHEKVYKWFNISFDVFGETPTEVHTKISQNVFNNLWENNLLVEKESEQYFCVKCDMFLCDRFMNGVCYHPKCDGITKGDECDKCNKFIDTDKLVKKWCSVCNETPLKKSTKHLYLKLEQFKDTLKTYFLDRDNLTNNPNGAKYMSGAATRLTKEWLNKELDDRSVTRDIKFAVKVPKLKGLEGYENKTMLPWLDAPYGYISILAHAHPETWKDWINPSVDWIQFMAKDNVPFHTIIFPVTLIGSGFQNLHCGVTHLSATEYLLFNGEKFSKSGGVGIFGDQIITISEKFGIDEDYWRYYLAKIRPENSDSTFTFEGFCEIIKGELAQKMGNLVNRGIAMSKKYYPQSNSLKYNLTLDLPAKLLTYVNNYLEAFEKFSYHEVISIINRVAEIGNEWINEQVLWITCRDTPTDSEYLMGNLLFIIWLFAELIEPIMPKKSEIIKGYFVESSIGFEKTNVTFLQLKKILIKGYGEILLNTANSQLLFKQIKIEELLELNTF